jgi:hypothetical protein
MRFAGIPPAIACHNSSARSDQMFLFFSNRLGCLGSLLISAALTILLILIFTR